MLIGIVVDDFGDEYAVNIESDLGALGDEMVFVPVLEAEVRAALGRYNFGGGGFAFFVEHRFFPTPGEGMPTKFVV